MTPLEAVALSFIQKLSEPSFSLAFLCTTGQSEDLGSELISGPHEVSDLMLKASVAEC